MAPLIETVRPYINHYGYWAVFVGVFLESLGLPLPGETLIIVAGLVAAKGILNFYWVMILATTATFIANNLSYAGGYFGGRAFVSRYGHYVFIDDKKIQSLEQFVKKHGSKVMVAARFILGLRQFNGFIAGMGRMPYGKFVLFNLIGAILWVLWWTGLSYYFGKRFDMIFVKFYFLTGIIMLAVFIFMACRYSIRKSSKIILRPSS